VTIQNVQLSSINGASFQLLSIEPPLLQNNSLFKLTDLLDVNIPVVTDGYVLSWSSSQTKFILRDVGVGGGGSGNLVVNGFNTSSLTFQNGFDVQSSLGFTTVNLDTDLSSLSDVAITSPTLGQVLNYNGTNWVNSNSNALGITVGSATGIQTLIFSGQFGVNSAGNTATINFSETFSTDDLTDVTINTPVLGQLIRYNGTEWVNNSLVFNPSDFSTSVLPSTTTINTVAKDINWLTDVNITSPDAEDLLFFDGVQWVNKPFTFNLGASQAAYGIYFTQYPNTRSNLFLDGFSFNYGELPALDGWFLDFKGIQLNCITGVTGYAQTLSFPAGFEFDPDSFSDTNQPTPANEANLKWLPNYHPEARFFAVIDGSFVPYPTVQGRHFGLTSVGGSFTVKTPSSPINGQSFSITDIGNSLSTNPVSLVIDQSFTFSTTGTNTFSLNSNRVTYRFIFYNAVWHLIHDNLTTSPTPTPTPTPTSSGISIFDEGVPVASNVVELNFRGDRNELVASSSNWTPNDIYSDVLFWISGDTGYGDLSSAQRVPLNSANRPTIVSSVLNGHAVFDSSPTKALSYPDAYDTNFVSVFVVNRATSADARLINTSSNSSNDGYRSLFDFAPLRLNIASNTVGDPVTSYEGGAVTTNNWSNIEYRGSDNTLYSDGNALTTTVADITSVSIDTLANSNININAVYYNNSTGIFSTFSGASSVEIAEIVVINRFASVEDHESVEGYLAHKYDLTIALPLAHPYKTVAPASPSGNSRVTVSTSPNLTTVKTSNFTATRNNIYLVSTATVAITATLSSNITWFVGDVVTFVDTSGTLGSNTTGFGIRNLTVNADVGQNIGGLATLVLNTACQNLKLIYSGSGRFDII
jgi:hypothetical protein